MCVKEVDEQREAIIAENKLYLPEEQNVPLMNLFKMSRVSTEQEKRLKIMMDKES